MFLVSQSSQQQASLLRCGSEVQCDMFSVVGEVAILAIASLSSAWELNLTASNCVISLAFALSICSASVLSIAFFQGGGDNEHSTTAAEPDYEPGAGAVVPCQGAEVAVEPPATVPFRPTALNTATTGVGNRRQRNGALTTSKDNGGVPLENKVDVSGASGKYGMMIRSSANGPETAQQPTPPTTKRTRPYRRGGEVLYIAEGVAQAAVGLVRDPVRGAQVDGAKGLVKGIGSGVLGVVGRPARGVARAGANAYTGMRIGASRAGRVIGSVRAGAGGSRCSVKLSAPQNGQRAPQMTFEDGHQPPPALVGGLELRDAEEEKEEKEEEDLAADGGAAVAGGGDAAAAAPYPTPSAECSDPAGVAGAPTANGRRDRADVQALAVPRRRKTMIFPPFDGLVVGVATVPLVVSSVFLLVESNSAGGGGEEKLLPRYSSDAAAAAAAASGVCTSGVELVEYLEAVLEGSVLCSVWEVVFAFQRVLRGKGRRDVLWRFLTCGPLRLALLTVVCVASCRRPLLPLWCVALYDVLRSTLDRRGQREMRRLSLRPGEAAVLAQALTLWAVDACSYTFQQLRAPESRAWEGLFPVVPSRSDSMLVVQSGILGTLVSGLAVMLTRAVLPRAWASDNRGHAVTYVVFASSTVAWLYAWTAALLGSNPVSWIILYALGSRDPSRQNAAEFSANERQATSQAWERILPHVAVEFFRGMWSELRSTGAAAFGGGFEEGMDVNRPLLAAVWVLELAVVVPFTPWVVKRLSLRKTTARKVFHALVTAMFVPAIALERDFLSLSLGVALGVLLALEVFRCSGCPPMARVLNGYYVGFLDARDGGCLVVTHLFLLLGCAVPVWLTGLVDQPGVLPYAGVVVLGIGDAMGAVVGSRIGRCQWPGSRRTMEGSAAVFVSSLLGLVLLSRLEDGGLGWGDAVARLAWPVALASLMEAFTCQVDNLVLPCVLLSCLALQYL